MFVIHIKPLCPPFDTQHTQRPRWFFIQQPIFLFENCLLMRMTTRTFFVFSKICISLTIQDCTPKYSHLWQLSITRMNIKINMGGLEISMVQEICIYRRFASPLNTFFCCDPVKVNFFYVWWNWYLSSIFKYSRLYLRFKFHVWGNYIPFAAKNTKSISISVEKIISIRKIACYAMNISYLSI